MTNIPFYEEIDSEKKNSYLYSVNYLGINTSLISGDKIDNYKYNIKVYKALSKGKLALFCLLNIFILFSVISFILVESRILKYIYDIILSICLICAVIIYLLNFIFIIICLNIHVKYITNFMNKINLDFQREKNDLKWNLVILIYKIFLIFIPLMIYLFKELHDSKDKPEDVISRKSEEIRNLNNNIRTKDSEIRKLNEKINRKESEIRKLNDKINRRESLIRYLNNDIRTKDSEIRNLKNEIINKKNSTDELTSRIGNKNNNSNILNISNNESEIEDLKIQLKEKNKLIKKLRKENNELLIKLNNNQNDIQTTFEMEIGNDKKNKKQKEIDDLNKINIYQKQQYEDIIEKKDGIIKQNQKIINDLNKLVNLNKNKENDAIKLKEELQKKDKIIKEKQEEINKLNKKIIEDDKKNKEQMKKKDNILKEKREQISRLELLIKKQKDELVQKTKRTNILESAIPLPYRHTIQEGEELICVLFLTLDHSFFHAFICKSKQVFIDLEAKLFEEISEEYRRTTNVYTANGRGINRNKTLEENGIRNESLIYIARNESTNLISNS